ncbi:hypothetical protein [Diplocloster hominis]|uniref:hypothetical protein n=1 Tax=Diplocloster hominis TaxID=3079010 RepID=UPI0031BAFB82
MATTTVDLGPVIGPQGPAGAVDPTTPIPFTTPSTDADMASGDPINTLFGKIKKRLSVLVDKIGDLTTLTTTSKTSAVSAINEINNNLYRLNYGSVVNITAVNGGAYTFGANGVFSVFVRNMSSNLISASYFFAKSDKKSDWRIMCNVAPDCYDSREIIVNQGEKLTFSIANLAEVSCKFIPFVK